MIATFDTATAAQAALTDTLRAPAPPARVIRFGRSIFSTSFGDQDKESLAEPLRARGAVIQFEGRRPYSFVHVAVQCEAATDQSAEALVETIADFAEAPVAFALRPPWDISEPIRDEDSAARSAYRKLSQYLASRLVDAKFPMLARSYLRDVEHQREGKAAVKRRKLIEIRKTVLEDAAAAFPHDAGDSPLLAEYFRYQEAARGSAVFDLYAERSQLGERMGQYRNFRVAASSYLTGLVHDGRRVTIGRTSFRRTDLGLPALVRFLCDRGCGNIEYTIE